MDRTYERLGRDIKARGNRAADMAAHEAANRDCTAPILTVGLPPQVWKPCPQPPSIPLLISIGFKKMPALRRAKTDGIGTKMTT